MLFEAALADTDRAFLAEVRAFLDAELGPEVYQAEDALRSQVCDHPRQEAWIDRLRPRRWHVGFWPREHGGAGLSQVQNYLLLYEQGRRGAPLLSPLSITYVGPVVMAFGTREQQQTLLPAIIDGRDHWCQGFSEPGAGSDLGSVATFAERRGDRYVVNGSKIWTTDAHHANKIFCLLRTRREPTKDALSFLLIDMDAPGVDVRPIRLMSGDHEFNQVFFDDVEVPVENLLGDEGGGWAVSKYLLEMERGAFVFGGRLRRRFELLLTSARSRRDVPRAFWDEAARVDIELMAYEATEFRLGHLRPREQQTAAEPNVIKIGWTETIQRLDELALMIAPSAWLYESERENGASKGGLPMASWLAGYFNNRAATIYGGSNEVQRELICRSLRRALA
ncbi:MAG: acyl-CoA dehydrogenase family protein [Gammaproteobacteria bacterium]